MSEPYADSASQAVLIRMPKGAARRELPGELPGELPLELLVRDREVIEALLEREAGDDRERFALDALRIGVIALRNATGRVDAELIQRETSQMLASLGQTLDHHARQAREQLNGSLKEYFDPQDGRFNERVQRLVAHDGELARLMREQIDGENSRLARTMLAHVGRESPLMKVLDPEQSQGLLAALRQAVEGQLTEQSERVLKEFSLDNDEGALARLVRELTIKHGDLSKDLHAKIDDVVKEFSLDEENSALSRLVRNVDHAQRTISSEFSFDNEQSAFSRLNQMLLDTQGAIHKSLTLDDDGSPLARLRKELFQLLEVTEKKNTEFQQQVRESLASMTATKKEAERSTRHGMAFEDAVYEFIAREAAPAGDVVIPTGNTTGQIRSCKVGDCIVELSPDCEAAGERIVVEAKQHGSYDLAKARMELETARRNRDAALGLFVFSKRLAPAGLDSLQRYGNDIVCVWDPEDPTTDVYLKAALILARGLSLRTSRSVAAQVADFQAIDKAINDIEKHARNLDTIRTSAQTIQSSADKIIDRVRKDEKAFEKQLAILREKMDEVREAMGCREA